MSEMNSTAIQHAQRLLGSRVRQLRVNHQFDQHQLAERAGVSARSITNLETGRGSTTETLIRVLKALDSLDTLEQIVPTISVNPLALLRNPNPPQRVRRPRGPRKPKPTPATSEPHP
jgi:transcriptional regulator with XRE-family HTH domain